MFNIFFIQIFQFTCSPILKLHKNLKQQHSGSEGLQTKSNGSSKFSSILLRTAHLAAVVIMNGMTFSLGGQNINIIPWFKMIIWVIGVLRRTVVCDWRFDNLCGCHLQSQVIVLVSWKFKNSGERFDRSIDRVAVGKRVMWLAAKTCAEIGYANSGL